ncbi:hypothetical protein LSUE1_G004109 [Lachnellula suecica]|uniref:Xylanolytic transcriptional activator regulatory domain-containing protein n=1 Tax=Lachnellula suecica TaxID=602035 RepID=A0A8T9C448_9HELO|nr:hypothetical protein LSUE1_G004109 [Lachnellula suecica]
MTKVRLPASSPNSQSITDPTPSVSSGVTDRYDLSASSQYPLTSPTEEPGDKPQPREIVPWPGLHPEDGVPGGQSTVAIQKPRKKGENWKDAVFQKSARYHGPTSFSAVFLEHRDPASEDLLEIGQDVRPHPGAWKFGQPLLGRERPEGPTMRTKEVVKALMNIPSREICESLLGTLNITHDLILNPTLIKHCITTLWATFEQNLITPRTAEKLTGIAEVLFQNEENPLPPSPEDGLDWLNTFMGSNVRLEMMGVLFCFFGKAYLALQDWDPVFKVPENHDRDRKETAWRMKECADICRKMCHFSETVNELVVALCYNVGVLESLCAGDESYTMGHRHGDMVTMAIDAGLHRLPDYANTPITTASEYKRRLFSAVYFLDKTHSALNGIPPLLGRLYCDVKPCLDIADEELFLPVHAFAVVISRLDPNGWSTSGNIQNISVSRAIWQLCSVREEILELALGVNVLVTEARIEELRIRSQLVLDGIPEQLRYYADSDRKVPKESTGKALFAQANLMNAFLQNIFLIERVSTARGFPNNERLLNAAMEMLELSLMFWMMRDKLTPFTFYFDWIVTFYGIPSAGVICVELLKNVSTSQTNLGFSRSDAIQKLTLFIGFLDWIRPTDGNYKLANRLKKVIRRVLDRVLEPPQTDPRPPDEMENALSDSTMLQPLDNMNDMDWLNTIDWTQGSWMDYN